MQEKKKKNREIQSDFIRVVAMIFVVAIHTPLGNLSDVWWFTGIRSTICFTCNAMFFMLSGKYNLRFQPVKGEEGKSYLNYYGKRVVSVFVPFFLFSIFYYIVGIWGELATTSFPGIIKGFLKTFTGTYTSAHLWFMYPLIGMMISAPFLARMLQAMSDLELKILFIVGICWEIASILISQDGLRVNFGFSGWMLSVWIFYFVLGYLMDRLMQKQYEMPLILIGLVGIVITVLQGHFLPDRAGGLYDLSPVYTMVCIGMYVFLQNCCKVKGRKIQKGISFIAKYSFSVYMVHYILIKPIEQYMVIGSGGIDTFLIRLVITTVCSLLVAMIVDTVIMNPIKGILTKVLTRS